MMIETETQITFDKATWEEMRADDYYRDLVEAIEDRETLRKAKEETEYFVDLEVYHQNRIRK